jgi:ketosteroid isomerase-like protein
MSQENLQIIRDWTAALNRGDLDAWSEAWADDVDYRAVEGAPDDHGPIRGKAAMRAYVQDWIDTFDQFQGRAAGGDRRGTGPSRCCLADQRTGETERRRD